MFIQLLGVLLGPLARLRKATIRLVMSACLSVRPFARKQLGSNWTDFHEILRLRIFRKYVEKFKFH